MKVSGDVKIDRKILDYEESSSKNWWILSVALTEILHIILIKIIKNSRVVETIEM